MLFIFTDVERQVQSQSSTHLIVYKLLMDAPFILFTSLFCGAWSDRVGRKLPIVVACVGAVVAVIVFLFSTFRGAPSIMLIMIGALIRGCFGKSAVVTMSLQSYISDISTDVEKTQRMSRLLAMSFLGYFVGSTIAGLILQKGGVQGSIICAGGF